MEIFRNMGRRKLRSFLTITGIVIGIFALTTMGAMAEHFNALIAGGVTYFGQNIQVTDDSGGFSGVLDINKAKDIDRVDGVAAAIPSVSLPAKPGDLTAVSFGPPDTIASSDPRERELSKFRTELAQGRRLNPDLRGEVVLGSDIANEFKSSVGSTLDLPRKAKDAKPDFVNHPFTVVGILKKTNTGPDVFAEVNLADAQLMLQESLPAALRNRVPTDTLAAGITAYGKPGVDLDKLADKITAEVPGVKAIRPSVIVNSFKQGGAIFTAITTGAALLALVIGGLSVVNTMIMAVTERFREIGLKKAVGAHTRHILREYLLEATAIGLAGGLIGYLLGAGLVLLLNAALKSQNLELFLITPALTVLALAFATGLGAVAGVIPAFRAARLDPVTALRSQS